MAGIRLEVERGSVEPCRPSDILHEELESHADRIHRAFPRIVDGMAFQRPNPSVPASVSVGTPAGEEAPTLPS
jgi:hypothetical protein